jgi:hypothetical protein
VLFQNVWSICSRFCSGDVLIVAGLGGGDAAATTPSD